MAYLRGHRIFAILVALVSVHDGPPVGKDIDRLDCGGNSGRNNAGFNNLFEWTREPCRHHILIVVFTERVFREIAEALNRRSDEADRAVVSLFMCVSRTLRALHLLTPGIVIGCLGLKSQVLAQGKACYITPRGTCRVILGELPGATASYIWSLSHTFLFNRIHPFD